MKIVRKRLLKEKWIVEEHKVKMEFDRLFGLYVHSTQLYSLAETPQPAPPPPPTAGSGG